MEDNNKIRVAKEWVLKLANGINPLDDSPIKDDDIVNNVHISRCLFYVADFIESTISKKNKKVQKYERPFYLSTEELGRVYIPQLTGIANFVREINKLVPSDMEPLSYGKILNWLAANGYMEEVPKENGGKTKHPTDSGRSIGITTTTKEGIKGPYTAVEYNVNAQQFILDHIHAIIEA